MTHTDRGAPEPSAATAPRGVPTGWKKWTRRVVQVGLVVAAIVAIRVYQQRGTASGMAPPIDAPALDGAWLRTSELRGQPVIVHFWATWCGVCRAMEGSVVGVAEDERVIAVATRSGGADEVGRYAREHHLDMPIVLDEGGTLAARYGVHALPTTFVLDPDGRIRFTEVGFTTGLGLRARLWLAGR